MPDSDTFSIKPIGEFVRRYVEASTVSIDPFARDCPYADYTNDLNPDCAAMYHMDAVVFLDMLAAKGVRADLLILDPPYSPRQISECYKAAGMTVRMKDTQNSALYAAVKRAAMGVLSPTARVLSFGWNSAGIGYKKGFQIEEIMLVAHGGAHNDTICMSERRVSFA